MAIESSRVEHRTGLSCSKLEVFEFDRVDRVEQQVKHEAYFESNKASCLFDSIFRARDSCSTRIESSRSDRVEQSSMLDRRAISEDLGLLFPAAGGITD
jgi:hypothetical protein